MADGRRQDRNPVTAVAVVLQDHRRDKVRAVALPDHHRAMAQVAVLRGHRRVKVRAAVLLGHRRVKVRADVLLGRRRVKAQVAVLRASQAVVGTPRDHHPVKGVVEMVVVTAAAVVVDKAVVVAAAVAAAVVETTSSSSSTINRDLSPVAGSGTDLRLQQHASDAGNIKGFASLAPAPFASTIHIPDQAPVFKSAWSIDKKRYPCNAGSKNTRARTHAARQCLNATCQP